MNALLKSCNRWQIEMQQRMIAIKNNRCNAISARAIIHLVQNPLPLITDVILSPPTNTATVCGKPSLVKLDPEGT
jgi:hypothetical protein